LARRRRCSSSRTRGEPLASLQNDSGSPLARDCRHARRSIAHTLHLHNGQREDLNVEKKKANLRRLAFCFGLNRRKVPGTRTSSIVRRSSEVKSVRPSNSYLHQWVGGCSSRHLGWRPAYPLRKRICRMTPLDQVRATGHRAVVRRQSTAHSTFRPSHGSDVAMSIRAIDVYCGVEIGRSRGYGEDRSHRCHALFWHC